MTLPNLLGIFGNHLAGDSMKPPLAVQWDHHLGRFDVFEHVEVPTGDMCPEAGTMTREEDGTFLLTGVSGKLWRYTYGMGFVEESA